MTQVSLTNNCSSATSIQTRPVPAIEQHKSADQRAKETNACSATGRHRQPLADSASSNETVISVVGPANGPSSAEARETANKTAPSAGRIRSLLRVTRGQLNSLFQAHGESQRNRSNGYLSLVGLAQRLGLARRHSGSSSTSDWPSSATCGGRTSQSAPTTPTHQARGQTGPLATGAKSVRFSCASSERVDRACQTTDEPIDLKSHHSDAVEDLDQAQNPQAEDPVRLVERLFASPDLMAARAPPGPMDSGQFKEYGYRLIDYICNYLDTIRDRRVSPLNIEPGYLKSLIAARAPERGEPFGRIMRDFESHIMCGITHWQHPHFHAYFPAGNAYPSILADMLGDALGCVGFSWAASPAYTELEIIMLDWMGKMIGLPDEFLCLSGAAKSKGGGVIQGSASECVLVNLLAARHWAIERLRPKYPDENDGQLLSRLIAYCSKEAHSCVEKAAIIGFITMRALDTDENHSLRGPTLARAIEADLAAGLEPFMVCATLGTTSCVSFDNLDELGQVCAKYPDQDLWLHVDAAYAGSALICPEFQHLIRGIERVTSFNMNPNKWLLINFDCSLMWVRDRFKLTRAFVVDPLYLQHSFSDQAIDYRHWGIPLSRRFRALKLWFVIRNYGVEGLRAYIRRHVRLAKMFAELIRKDSRFCITNQVVLGLVCFRLVGSNALNQRLLSLINGSGKLHMIPASLEGNYVIRFCVCDQNAQERDIRFAYDCISSIAGELLESVRVGRERMAAMCQQNTIDVSSVSLHTQQSASGSLDRTNHHGSRQYQLERSHTTQGVAPVRQQVSTGGRPPAGRRQIKRAASATREAARNYLVGRRMRRPEENAINGQSTENVHCTEQNGLDQRPAASGGTHNNGTQAPGGFINGLAGVNSGTVADIEDDEVDELDEENLLASSLEGGVEEAFEEDEPEEDSLSCCPLGDSKAIQRARATPDEDDEQPEDEETARRLADERRKRMSIKYKREFFVRMVSDPRVHRANISVDLNPASTSAVAVTTPTKHPASDILDNR